MESKDVRLSKKEKEILAKAKKTLDRIGVELPDNVRDRVEKGKAVKLKRSTLNRAERILGQDGVAIITVAKSGMQTVHRKKTYLKKVKHPLKHLKQAQKGEANGQE